MSECMRDHFSNSQPVAAAVGLIAGTLIETASGPREIQTLKLGDLVETLDGGLQPLRSMSRNRMRGTAGSAPVRFQSGVLGNTAPLLLAPQHRVLMTGWQAELYFGQDEILIEAVGLVNGTSVTREVMAQIEFFGLGFDDHQILHAQGALIESDLPHGPADFLQAMTPRPINCVQGALARFAIAGNDAAVLAL